MTPTGLPDADLDPGGPLSARFIAQGAWRYRDAARLVWGLPYGRPARSGLDAVLRDGRGTRSTKHALLAALADEAGLDVGLRLGLYLMDGQNTPGVGPVLRAHGLAAVPEAHCVLAVGDDRVDLARPGVRPPVPEFVEEEAIRPDQVGAYERDWHRRRLGAWAEAHDLDPAVVWAAREAAVARLARV